MAMRRKMCFVRECPTEDNEPGVRFFHFPRTEDRFSQWVKFCDNNLLSGKSRLECSNHFICSRHFARDAFQNELLLKLNRNSYPTLLAPSVSPSDDSAVPFQFSDPGFIQGKLAWESLAPSCEEGIPVPDDGKVFEIAYALKAQRDALSLSYDVENIDTLLMGLSEWNNLDDAKRKYYFNRAVTLYDEITDENHPDSQGKLYSRISADCEVSSSQEVCEETIDCGDSTTDSSSSQPKEVTVICVAFM